MNLGEGNWTATLPSLTIGERSGKPFAVAPGMTREQVQAAVIANMQHRRSQVKQSGRWLQKWTQAGRPMPQEK